MREIFCRERWFSILAVAAIAFAGVNVEAEDSASVKAKFVDPPREYSTAPFWVWNDMMTDEQVVSTLRDLAGQGIRQAFVHPRPGLMTPYLSEEWFRPWKVALKEAKQLGMDLWIYDENSYPSGFAGGFVPDAMPESRGQGLGVRKPRQAPKLTDEIVVVYRLARSGYENVTEKIRAGEKLGEGKYLVVSKRLADKRPWYGGKYYVDLLRPGVTEKFLEVTMEPYRREISEEFGKRVPGVFTDEPRLTPAGGHHWTDDLPEVFERRWGYRLTDHLPSLFEAVGDWKRVRHNYFKVLTELFIERWGKPYYEYCEKYDLEFTGHYWEHEWPKCMLVPDNMAMYAWQQRPGIDTLMNQYKEDTHAQFGNVRAVKELASVANQLGLKRTLCEAYGASGWDLRFEDMKRIGDWLYVFGINTMNEHLSYVTIRGARKRDHPPSFSYHEPWWEAYRTSSSYFGRLSAVLSAGEQVNKVLVIEPTTTAWMYQADAKHSEHLKKVGDGFQELVVELAKTQVEYDIGCEEIVGQHGSVEGSVLKVGKRRYETVVLPPLTENLNSKTMELLEGYVKGGGEILCCGDAPVLVDGVQSNRGKALSANIWWREVRAGTVAGILLSESNDGFSIRRDRGDQGILYHHRRRLDDGEILFLVNTSIDSGSSGKIESSMRGVEGWDAETGETSPYAFETTGDGIKADFELARCGSLLLFLSKEPRESGAVDAQKSRKVSPAGLVRIRRVTPNVLTLDYVDVTAGSETMKSTYFYRTSEFVFEKHGLGQNPWDSAVQFRDELISKKFPADSGFEATYRFRIEKKVPKPLYIVIERADLYEISCNGKAVTVSKGSWWLDKAFGKIDITSAAKVGENAVTIKASPMTMYHELESAYVLGEFALKATDSGFVIVPDKGLKLGQWDEQGHPFYAGGVSYTQSFNISKVSGQYYVRLPSWYGSVAKVAVNGEAAGYIWHQPWELKVTEQIKEGRNNVEVIVIGTFKNTLGPHHGNPPQGSAWPSMFKNGPRTGPPAGEQYETIGYGLFEPFELHRR
ncbi:MAG: hypothetical protein JSV99_09280 [Planctomycetota bacterium]|nr:MAG: hypothetical protein JSV99_09280 [Planctomycetota bacterium]